MKKLLSIPQSAIKSLLSLFFLLSAIGLMAQQVSGTVKDRHGSPLVGAAVLVKGTSNGTVTNADGAFSLNDVAKGATLVVSFVGYVSQEINANGSNVSIILQLPKRL